jgi:hypothetical protein
MQLALLVKPPLILLENVPGFFHAKPPCSTSLKQLAPLAAPLTANIQKAKTFHSGDYAVFFND